MNDLLDDDIVPDGEGVEDEFYKSAFFDMIDLINVTNVLDRVSRGF